jgi:hypothetical protein
MPEWVRIEILLEAKARVDKEGKDSIAFGGL